MKIKEVKVSKIGEMIPQDWKRWGENLVRYTLPLFSGVLFAQLAQGVSFKVAFSTSLVTLYGAISDYINKKNAETKYL